ncbi:lipopolysaccharide biosynthesis protein, partial [bacterium]|nr:lipopolysaccharide biosynthesis protein [bacterium]
SRAEQEEPTTSRGGSDYITKYRDYKYQETLFELFTKQYEMARIDEAREGAVIQVVDVALPPERKAKPKKAQMAIIATLGSGFVLLLFVFIRNALRNAQQSPETAKKLAQLQQSWRRALGRKIQ